MMFALLYYAFSARKWFTGPRVNIEHVIHGTTTSDSDSPGELGNTEKPLVPPAELGIEEKKLS